MVTDWLETFLYLTHDSAIATTGPFTMASKAPEKTVDDKEDKDILADLDREANEYAKVCFLPLQ